MSMLCRSTAVVTGVAPRVEQPLAEPARPPDARERGVQEGWGAGR